MHGTRFTAFGDRCPQVGRGDRPDERGVDLAVSVSDHEGRHSVDRVSAM
jgi:hypothetical protein